MEKHIRLNITLPRKLADELTSVSIEIQDKKSRIITRALELYFDELDTVLAENRLDEIGDNISETIPAKDVWQELGL